MIALLQALLVFLGTGLLSGPRLVEETKVPSNPSAERGRLGVDDVTGLWRVTRAAGGAGCTIALDRFGEGVYGVHVEACAIPAFARAKGWRLAGDRFEVLDERGAVLARFRQTEVDVFTGVDADWRLSRAPLA